MLIRKKNIYISDVVPDASAGTDLSGSDGKDSFQNDKIVFNEEETQDDIKNQEKDYTDSQGYISTDSKLKTSTQSLFEQRQRQYLKGRKATKTITDNVGKVIINSGEVISEDVIDIAKDNGKLIELVMNNKA